MEKSYPAPVNPALGEAEPPNSGREAAPSEAKAAPPGGVFGRSAPDGCLCSRCSQTLSFRVGQSLGIHRLLLLLRPPPPS